MMQACRRLWRTPAFSLAAIIALALALGANAAVFAVVHRIVLNPLPYPESDRLLKLEQGSTAIRLSSGIGLTAGLFFQYQRAHTLDSLAIYRVTEATLAGGGEPFRMRVARSSPSLLGVLRMSPAVGRWFTEAEATVGAAPVVVLSHALWAGRYGGSPSIVGRGIRIDGTSATVIGVMPEGFAFPDTRVDAWMPTSLSRAAGFGLPFGYEGIARLRDGVTITDARADLNALIADLPRVYPGDTGVLGNVNGGLQAVPRTLKDAIVGNISRALWLLFAAMTLVLIVAGANIANLFLVRSDERQRELAVRRALGASNSRIVRFFLGESLLVSLAGGTIGTVLAWMALRLLVSMGPPTLPRLDEVRLDATTVAFTVTLTIVSALAFGALPLLRRAPLALSIREGGRGNTAGHARQRARHALMAAQVAVALVLLVVSGLMLRSFEHLRSFDLGFDPASALTFRIGLPERDYPTRAAAVRAHDAILEQLSHLAAVTAVSASTGIPLADACFGNSLRVEGRDLPRRNDPIPAGRLCAVSADYLNALKGRLIRGRALGRDDIERQQPNVMINQALAERLFPDEDPIGRRFRSNAPPTPTPPAGAAWTGTPPWLTVVGVIANTPWTAIGESPAIPAAYLPMSIAGGPDIPPIAMLGPSVAAMTYVVRSPVRELLPQIRRAVDTVDPALAISQVRTLDDVVARASEQMAFTMVLLAVAAIMALLLGIVGIYGVIAYVVTQRTGEIGVRLALGASPGAVAGMIVRQGGVVAASGMVIGIAGALAVGRVMESLLYDVSPWDPIVFVVTAIGLFIVAMIACWVPARRAARIDPLIAMRAE
jgi:predicted permease